MTLMMSKQTPNTVSFKSIGMALPVILFLSMLKTNISELPDNRSDFTDFTFRYVNLEHGTIRLKPPMYQVTKILEHVTDRCLVSKVYSIMSSVMPKLAFHF